MTLLQILSTLVVVSHAYQSQRNLDFFGEHYNNNPSLEFRIGQLTIRKNEGQSSLEIKGVFVGGYHLLIEESISASFDQKGQFLSLPRKYYQDLIQFYKAKETHFYPCQFDEQFLCAQDCSFFSQPFYVAIPGFFIEIKAEYIFLTSEKECQLQVVQNQDQQLIIGGSMMRNYYISINQNKAQIQGQGVIPFYSNLVPQQSLMELHLFTNSSETETIPKTLLIFLTLLILIFIVSCYFDLRKEEEIQDNIIYISASDECEYHALEEAKM